MLGARLTMSGIELASVVRHTRCVRDRRPLDSRPLDLVHVVDACEAL